MKVLLIAENWPPRDGGIENYLTHIAGLLPKQSVTVVTPAAHVSEKEHGSGIREVIRTRFFWPLIKPSWWPLWLKIKKLAEREHFDVVLCGKALMEGQIGYRLKKKLGIPYVVFTYAMEVETWRRQGHNRRKLLKVLAGAESVVYINEQTKKTLLELGVTTQQLVKIWPGVDDRFFAGVPEQEVTRVLQRYNLTQPYVFTMCRLISRKGVDVLIEGFAKLDQMKFRSYQLVIGGDGPERQHLAEVAERNFVNTSVRFIGRVPDEDLPALYKGASVFALTPREDGSDIEGFGIVYMEAAASGTPAVGTLTGGVPEAVLGEQTGVLVSPDSPAAVADALARLLGDGELRRKLGEAARQRAWNEFRWSKRILLVKGVLDAILAKHVLARKL